jgi:hypothetical protein
MIQWPAESAHSVLVDLEAELALVLALDGLVVVLFAEPLEGPEAEAERLVEAGKDVAVAE